MKTIALLFSLFTLQGYSQELTPATLYSCGPHNGVGLTLSFSSSGNVYDSTAEIRVTVTESNGGWQNPIIISLWASPYGSSVGFSDSIGYYYQPTSDSFTYTIPIYETTPGSIYINHRFYAVEVYIPNLNCGYPTVNPIAVLDSAYSNGPSTGISTIPETSFDIYPNPSTGDATIHYQLPPDVNSGEFVIYSSEGQIVKRIPVIGSGILQSGTMAPGIYFYQLITTDGVIIKKQIFIQ